MEYDEMMFLANMRRKAKVEFENNLWKRRFEELNGFPMEEGLFKENIIMPFSENDYLKNKTLDKATELMDNKGNSEEFEIQRTDYQRTDNRFSGYQKCSPPPFEECEPRDDSFDKVTFEQREDGRYFRRFATVGELVDALQKLPRDYKVIHSNYYESDSPPSLYYLGGKTFEIL